MRSLGSATVDWRGVFCGNARHTIPDHLSLQLLPLPAPEQSVKIFLRQRALSAPRRLCRGGFSRLSVSCRNFSGKALTFSADGHGADCFTRLLRDVSSMYSRTVSSVNRLVAIVIPRICAGYSPGIGSGRRRQPTAHGDHDGSSVCSASAF
jgi:hypothetical protein